MGFSKKEIQTTLRTLIPILSKENIKHILKISTYYKKEDKEIILKSYNLFFILQGTVRGYILDKKGLEKTVFLRTEGYFGGDIKTLFYNQPKTYYYEAIGETHVLALDIKDLETMAYSDHVLMQWYLSFLKDLIATLNYRVESMISMTAKERYLDLIRLNPEILEKVYAKHIASFLGITPVSLSRIISNLKKNSE